LQILNRVLNRSGLAANFGFRQIHLLTEHMKGFADWFFNRPDSEALREFDGIFDTAPR